jgi:hypothetical protein
MYIWQIHYIQSNYFMCNVSMKTVNSKMPGQRWSHQHWGCDNVLPDQGHHTSQGIVTERSGAMVEWWLPVKSCRNLKSKYSIATLSTINLTRSHMKLNPRLWGEKAIKIRSSNTGHNFTHISFLPIMKLRDSKGFWRWCIHAHLLGFRILSIIWYSKNYLTQLFGNWIFPNSILNTQPHQNFYTRDHVEHDIFSISFYVHGITYPQTWFMRSMMVMMITLICKISEIGFMAVVSMPFFLCNITISMFIMLKVSTSPSLRNYIKKLI